MPTHVEAISMVIEALTDSEIGVIKDMSEIDAVGHRIVHGGEKFDSSTILTDEVYKAIEECCELAPLHNPAHLMGIDACKKLMPNTPMVCVFETAFHQTMRKRLIFTVCRSNTTKSIKYDATASTEQATAMYPRELPSFLASLMIRLRPLYATWATAPAAVQ